LDNAKELVLQPQIIFLRICLETCNEIKKLGFRIYPWTGNETEEIEAIEAFGG